MVVEGGCDRAPSAKASCPTCSALPPSRRPEQSRKHRKECSVTVSGCKSSGCKRLSLTWPDSVKINFGKFTKQHLDPQFGISKLSAVSLYLVFREETAIMRQVVISRLLQMLGFGCICAALILEVRGGDKKCDQVTTAHCQYHPCRCEDGGVRYGCAKAREHSATGWCVNGTANCTDDTEPCGNKWDYGAAGNCNSCSGGEQSTVPCNQFHNCHS